MKIFFVCICIFVFASCKEKCIKIPFEFNTEKSGMPQISLCFSLSEKSVDVIFGIDTGCEQNHFFNNTVEKVFGSIEAYQNLFLENGIDVNSLQDRYAPLMTFKNVRCGDYTIPRIKIVNSPDANDENLDGVIGYRSLREFGISVFDFRKNMLQLGRKRIDSNILPMKYKKIPANVDGGFMELISIPIEINGVEKYAIVDTGFDSGGELILLLANDIEKMEKMTVRIGNVFYENVSSIRVSDGNFAFSSAQDIFDDTSGFIILGNAFFQNHRIQLDFENMTFAMD